MKNKHALIPVLTGVVLFAGMTLVAPLRADAQIPPVPVESAQIDWQGPVFEITQATPIRVESQSSSSLINHLHTQLQSNAPMRRHLALLDISGLANSPGDFRTNLATVQNRQFHFVDHVEVETGEIMDLTPLVPALVESYYRGPDHHRLLALSALTGIGDEKALAMIVEDDGSPSFEIGQAARQHLSAYYLAQYPELTKKAGMTGEISLRDIDRLKRTRARKAEKALARG